MRILSLDPQNTTILNNYAYSLPVKGIKLKKALKMALVAVEKTPRNPAYLDTLGWIYFKIGNLDKALEYVNKSVEKDSTNSEVLEHLGDIYKDIGEDDKAKYYYQKAMDTEEFESTTIEKDIAE